MAEMLGTQHKIVQSDNGSTITTTDGNTYQKIGNFFGYEGMSIFTHDNICYGNLVSGGSGGSAMLPSVNYLFFNPYSTDTMKPGIYGFYKSFNKPMFVCDTNNDIFLLFMGRHSAYSETGDSYVSLLGINQTAYEVGKNNKQIGLTYYNPNDDSITAYRNGISQYNLDTCVGNDDNLYDLQHVRFNQVPTHVYGEDGGYTTGEDLAGVLLYKNGEIYDKKPLEEWYYNNSSHLLRMPWAHIREDGTYQCLYLCYFTGDSKPVDDYSELKSELPVITKTKRFTFPDGIPNGEEEYCIYRRVSDPNTHRWGDKKLVFSSSRLEDIYSFVDGGRNPFGNIWFYDYDFISYTEWKIFLYDSRNKAKEAKTYWLLRNSRISKSKGSLELNDNGKLKESGCYSVDFYNGGYYKDSYGEYIENTVSYAFESNKIYQYIFNSVPYDRSTMPGDTSRTEIVHSGDTDIDVEIGKDLKGNPINMTLAIHNGWIHKYKCLGYELDVPVREGIVLNPEPINDADIGDLVSHGYEIKSAEQVDANRYLLLTTEGIILINKKTGEYKNIFPTPYQEDRDPDAWIKYRESLCKYNTRLLKSDSAVKSRIKKNLRGR